MQNRKDEEDDKLLTHKAFSAHLQKFSYATPPKAMVSQLPSAQVLVTVPTKAAGEGKLRNEGKATSPQGIKRKRKPNAEPKATSQSPTPSKHRTTTKERAANDPYEPDNKLVDSLRPGLMLVFIGLNPGLETARTGYAYAHPTNQFWPLLHSSGITPVRHRAADTHLMPDLYNIGNTNLCVRATRSGDGLSKQEQADGAKIIEEKVAKYKPEAVCIVGKGIWDTIYKSKTGKTLKRQDFAYGWQDENLWLGRFIDEDGSVAWTGARTFVCTSTSGLAADTKPAEKLAIMSELGDWVKQHRKDLAKLTVKEETRPEAQATRYVGPAGGAEI